MRMRWKGETTYAFLPGSLVYDSRNKLAKMAVDSGADYIMWLDSDMIFEPDLHERLMDSIGNDHILTAICFRRKHPFEPAIYKSMAFVQRNNTRQTTAEIYLDYPQNARFKVAGCGAAAALMTTKCIMDVIDKKGLPFSPIDGFGEDLSFCYKARELGYQVYCDSRIKVGHLSQSVATEETYLAFREDKR